MLTGLDALLNPVDYYDEEEYLLKCERQANCYGDYDDYYDSL